ncbi:MAG: TGS domain-containing protein, partial [Phycisphaerales bacterium]|nr:TGS domain-containing protein [Phycisphaerales bacterium]
MPIITLPDGTTRSYKSTTSPLQVAEDISAGLASVAIGARINGELSDLSTPIESDAELKIVTA